MGWAWERPDAGARITSYATRLSARPTGVLPTIDRVDFTATSDGGARLHACTSTVPGTGGAWSCRAELLSLGIEPGRVTLAFTVHADGLPAERSPAGERQVTYAVPPPRPGDTRWREVDVQADRGDLLRSYRARWTAPPGYATEFRLYNTFECPRDARRTAGEPCFVLGTPVDTTRLELLATVPGDARSTTVHFREHDCGPAYGSVLLRAMNADGESGFAIVALANVPGRNDIIC